MLKASKILLPAALVGAAAAGVFVLNQGSQSQAAVRPEAAGVRVIEIAPAPQARAEVREEQLALADAKVEGATLKGVFKFKGEVPELPPLVAKGDQSKKDPSVCAAESVPNDELVVGKDGGLANVFIYLPAAPKGYKVPPPPTEPVTFDQKGCHFMPHGLVVRVGQPVSVLNGDPVVHNTHTYPLRGDGWNQTISASNRKGVTLNYTKGERTPIEVKCDLHTWMKAYHLPVEHPFAAVSNEKGEFEITGLPAGDHVFTIWHERKGYLDRKYKVSVKKDEVKSVSLEYTIDDLK